ncbi:MAG: hypothetical protein WA970_07695, partial [Gammaproteobacteria bacterium]
SAGRARRTPAHIPHVFPCILRLLLAPSLGLAPSRASLRLFKIVPDDSVAAARLAIPALATFLKNPF